MATRVAAVSETPSPLDVDGRDGAAERLSLAVGGMTCTSCAARVEKRLNRLDGVRASVNYATGVATVQAQPAVALDQLVRAVEDSGYTAEPLRGSAFAETDVEDNGLRRLWHRLLVAVILFVPLSDLAILFAVAPSYRFPGWRLVLTAVALPVVVWCAAPFHRAAWVAARHRLGTMDTLVSLGIIVASIWSIVTIYFGAEPAAALGWWATLRASGSIYLETAAGITVFVLAGRYFEARARRRSSSALRALAELTAKDATVLLADGREMRLPVAELKVGQRFVTRAGERISTDGRVEDGDGAVDMSAMTGESIPRTVGPQELVLGGTTLLTGRLISVATAVGADTALAGMMALVERAQSEKAATQRLADRIAAVFVPAVLVVALATFVGWLVVAGDANQGMTAGLAVLVIACPCALGLATPTALLVASGRAAQMGVFVTGHAALEATQAISVVVFDKTGTVTTGRPEVVETGAAPGVADDSWLHRAGAVEEAAEHVLSAPIARAARHRFGDLPPVTDFATVPGRGVRGRVEGHQVVVGSPRLLTEAGIPVPGELAARLADWESSGGTAVLVATDGRAAGLILLRDTVRPSARPAVDRLRRLGLSTMLITGDNAGAASQVGTAIGIDEVVADVLPADKAEVVRGITSSGRRAAFVGDGINDGPALAVSDLGMAMGAGTDVAIQAADMILVRSDLGAVPDAIQLAGATLRTIRWNFVWALAYNVAAIPIAVAGLADPLLASAAMALSSLFVVGNSLRLQRFQPSS